MNKLKLTFCLGLGLGLLVGFFCGRGTSLYREHRALPPVKGGQVGLPMESVEKEKEQFSIFLSQLDEVERVASEWLRDNASTTDHQLNFLIEKNQHELSSPVTDILNCTIDNPRDEYPHCVTDYFHFYDFICDYQGCSYTFCRAGDTPYSCIYSGSGYVEQRNVFHWEHSANILEEKAIPLGKWLYETRHWNISEVL